MMKVGNFLKNIFLVFVINMNCPNCKRLMPNKKHLTENGCIWCDTKRALREQKIKEFKGRYEKK